MARELTTPFTPGTTNVFAWLQENFGITATTVTAPGLARLMEIVTPSEEQAEAAWAEHRKTIKAMLPIVIDQAHNDFMAGYYAR